MSDDDLLAQLEACTLSSEQFRHADHLHAAWLYLTRLSTTQAIAQFCCVLRSYAASLGKADRYHETITWAYLLLVNERIHRPPRDATWEHFVAHHPDLFDWKNSILSRYYRKETLESDLARRVFLMPDRLPSLQAPSPSYPKHPVGNKEKQESDKSGQQVEEVEIAHREMDANGASEPGASHQPDDLDEASIEVCATRRNQEQTADGTESASEARPVV